MALSTATGVDVTLFPSTKAVVPPEVVTIGKSLTEVTVTVFVTALLLFTLHPSLTMKVRVRLDVFGRSEELV